MDVDLMLMRRVRGVPSPQPKGGVHNNGTRPQDHKEVVCRSESELDPIALNDIFSDNNKSVMYRGNDGDDEDEEMVLDDQLEVEPDDGFIVSDEEHHAGARGIRRGVGARNLL